MVFIDDLISYDKQLQTNIQILLNFKKVDICIVIFNAFFVKFEFSSLTFIETCNILPVD